MISQTINSPLWVLISEKKINLIVESNPKKLTCLRRRVRCESRRSIPEFLPHVRHPCKNQKKKKNSQPLTCQQTSTTEPEENRNKFTY